MPTLHSRRGFTLIELLVVIAIIHNNERIHVWALIRRKIVLKRSPRRLVSFGRCFPSSASHEQEPRQRRTLSLERDRGYSQDSEARGARSWRANCFQVIHNV